MIVVVGAGLIGLSIAYELAVRGAEVRVIDAGEAGRGASWAGAGMLAPFTEGVINEAFAAFCAESLARYPAFAADIERRGGVDARLRLDGIVEAAYDESQERRLRASANALCDRGLEARYVGAREARSLEPALGNDVRGASFSPSEGAIDNRRLGRALRAACLALAVRIDERLGEVALEADTRRVLGIRTVHGFVPADSVVNAAGAWAGALAGVPAHARVAVVPIKGQMLALAMPRGLVRRVVWVPGAYLVPRDDGRLLIGATVEDAGFDVRVTAGGVARLLAAALAALPALADLAVAETWAGLRPGTPDGLPHIGATALAGYVVATGHYRNGILLAPATAAAIADILEDRARDDLRAFSPQREEARVSIAKVSA
ncbi:MAG: glycine oxidase ThiO [Candidatus Eremiobacteraeota bacterium]|nr:glycine oxidase ThiO [Candidatus Eremiobacteraeota bacterium]